MMPSSRSGSPPTKRICLQDVSLSETPLIEAAKSTSLISDKPQKKQKQNKRTRMKPVKPGGAEETLMHDIVSLIGRDKFDQMVADKLDKEQRYERFEEAEVEIQALSSHGDGLALSESGDWVIIVPFALPGEKALVKVVRNSQLHSQADLLMILRKSDMRDDSLINCKYFGTCGGCQYQMISYEKQLKLKQTVVEKAFKNFSSLKPEQIPQIISTMPSPLEYNYRTKLTPHFELPSNKNLRKDWVVNIGFDVKGRKSVLDIEECSIATPIINDSLPIERANIKSNLANFKRGATVLLRDSLKATEDGTPDDSEHICVTDHKSIIHEKVGARNFVFPSNSFFQNNNSILPSLIDYVKSLLPRGDDKPKYLIDAYCGSGLFSIMLSDEFESIVGVEIDVQAVEFASRNSSNNGLSYKTRFVAGTASDIFSSITFDADKTVMIIDPPRKGCDEQFLDQLVKLRPETVIYVSCNVHTQARDIGILCGPDGPYTFESIRGCDLFPQTYHVEGVASLRLKR